MHTDTTFQQLQQYAKDRGPSLLHLTRELDWVSLPREANAEIRKDQTFDAACIEENGDAEEWHEEDWTHDGPKNPFGIKDLKPSSPERRLAKNHITLTSPQKLWQNANISRDPKYGSDSSNVFLKLQKRPLRNRHFDPRDDFIIGKTLPPPDDMDVQIIDSKYLSYFLRQVPQWMGCVCCLPEMISIFLQSNNQPLVRHSILALSSAIQQTQGGEATLYIQRNVLHIIPQIQQAISTTSIDSPHLISVTFLGWLALTSGDLPTAHRHLKGLLSMLKLTHHLTASAEPKRLEPHPLAMFLFRMAVKVDNTLGYRNQPLVMPILQYDEQYHRKWLKSTTSSEIHVQYSLATIQLDDLANNLLHLHRQTMRLRKERIPNAETAIRHRLASLRLEHQTWTTRPCLSRHIVRSINPRMPPELPESSRRHRFLSYPEYIIFDPLVAFMHMTHSYIAIHISIVSHGYVNPLDKECFNAATLVCRIFAALNGALGGNAGKKLGGCSTALWFAGLVFADAARNSPEGNKTAIVSALLTTELQWVNGMLLEIDEGTAYRSAVKLSDALVETSVTPGGDPWEIVGKMF